MNYICTKCLLEWPNGGEKVCPGCGNTDIDEVDAIED
jgi:RNA polymerase subunit RPABC4/transcription elongation factor Spt4